MEIDKGNVPAHASQTSTASQRDRIRRDISSEHLTCWDGRDDVGDPEPFGILLPVTCKTIDNS